MTISVSPARPGDHAKWRELFTAYATFDEVALTEADVDRAWSWIRDPEHPTCCLVARDEDGAPVGLAHYRAEDSPLSGTRGFLDDLFVDPAYRASGAVDALLGELRSVAVAQGWPSVRRRTAEDDYRARAVYDRHAIRTAFLTCSMESI